MDSPLLSYIDMQHANLLPPHLTVGETRDLGPWYTIAEDLAPVRDASTELVSQTSRVHVPVGEPEAQVQVVEPAAVESVNSLEVEADQSEEMMTK